MKSLFVNQKDLIVVKVVVAKDKKNENLYISNSKEDLLGKKEVDKDSLEEYEVRFKHSDYGDSVNIYSNSVNIEGNSVKVDPMAVRYKRFITLIKDWTFTDEDGKSLKVSEDNINALHPDLANFILDELERLTP